MGLSSNKFLSGKEISIDDAGWGDLILGVVIGAFSAVRNSHLKLLRQAC